MRAHSKLFAVLTTVGMVGAAGITLAAASFGPASRYIDDGVLRSAGAPVIGAALFTTPVTAATSSCVPSESILAGFANEESRFGGKVYRLGNGLQQAFADAWRAQGEIAPVTVSEVLVHLFPGQDGDWTADVVEIGADGCAATRTMIPGDTWTTILRAAAGPQV
ncbi:MAG TPA: hypothetical protein VFB16_08205 [Bauldia sp.]|nr:hypothetical protein [Bauldia sp.]